MSRQLLFLALVLATPECGTPGCTGRDQEQAWCGQTRCEPEAGTGGSGGFAATGGFSGGAGKPIKDAGTGGVGAAAQWTPLPGDAHGCKFERLATQQLEVFTWKPCAGVAGCEEATFNPGLWIESSDFLKQSILFQTPVVDDGLIQRAVLAVKYWDDPLDFFVTDHAGQALDGFRAPPVHQCISGASLWSERIGILAAVTKSDPLGFDFGFLLADVGAGVPLLGPLVNQPQIGGASTKEMGTKRWVFGWAEPHQIVSVASADAGDLRVLEASAPNGVAYSVSNPVSAGDHFLYHRVIDQGAQDYVDVRITNGLSMGTPYLTPPPGESYGGARFAHSHVAWMRGIGWKGTNSFDVVELWASPWSADPAKLVPKKLGVSLYTFMDYGAVAAWGRWAMVRPDGGIDVYDLETGAVEKLPPPPAPMKIWRLMGLTRTHLWVFGNSTNSNRGDHLLRYAVGP